MTPYLGPRQGQKPQAAIETPSRLSPHCPDWEDNKQSLEQAETLSPGAPRGSPEPSGLCGTHHHALLPLLGWPTAGPQRCCILNQFLLKSLGHLLGLEQRGPLVALMHHCHLTSPAPRLEVSVALRVLPQFLQDTIKRRVHAQNIISLIAPLLPVPCTHTIPHSLHLYWPCCSA